MSVLKRLFGSRRPKTADERRREQWSRDAEAARAKGRDTYLRFIREDRIQELETLTPELIADGRRDLALDNLGGGFGLVRERLGLSRYYWMAGRMDAARDQMEAALRDWDWHAREGGAQDDNPLRNRVAMAAFLLDADGPESKASFSQTKDGYMPSVEVFLQHAALAADRFDETRWDALQRAWFDKRGPKYMWADYQFYADALTGRWQSGDALLREHAKRWRARAKRNPDVSVDSGYGEDNLHIADTLFAVVLKRIGWDGDYAHAWPPVLDAVATRVEPTLFLEVEGAEVDVGRGETVRSLAENIASIEQSIERILSDREGYGFDDSLTRADMMREDRHVAKVESALRKLGLDDESLRALSRRYVLHELPHTRDHLHLCDPVGRWGSSLADVTAHFRDEHGLSPDFVMLCHSGELSDLNAPEGQYAVLDRMSGAVLMANVDEWADADATRRDTVRKWPDYASFVAWWLKGPPLFTSIRT